MIPGASVEGGLSVRQSRPEEADALARLAYLSGPDGFDYVFAAGQVRSADQFLARSIRKPAGEFGYGCRWTLADGQRIVATGAGFSGRHAAAFMVAALGQIVASYPAFTAAGVIVRGLRIERVLPPPSRDEFYLAHIAVDPEERSRGLGSILVSHLVQQAKKFGLRKVVLDVAEDNARARALYERQGFDVVVRRESRLSRERWTVPNYLRMQRDL